MLSFYINSRFKKLIHQNCIVFNMVHWNWLWNSCRFSIQLNPNPVTCLPLVWRSVSRHGMAVITWQWRHNECDGVSNHQPHHSSRTDQRKHQNSASLAFVMGIHRDPVNSPHQGPVTRKMFPFDDVIMKDHDKGRGIVVSMQYGTFYYSFWS